MQSNLNIPRWDINVTDATCALLVIVLLIGAYICVRRKTNHRFFYIIGIGLVIVLLLSAARLERRLLRYQELITCIQAECYEIYEGRIEKKVHSQRHVIIWINGERIALSDYKLFTMRGFSDGLWIGENVRLYLVDGTEDDFDLLNIERLEKNNVR